jgi:hypothetical protein
VTQRQRRDALLAKSENKLEAIKLKAEREAAILSGSRRIEEELFRSRNVSAEERRRRVEEDVERILSEF